mgnify:CR=1 FL=1
MGNRRKNILIMAGISKLETAREFFSAVSGLKRFGEYCNPEVFKYLFRNNWKRLWECFVIDCNRNILLFYCGNYLSNEEMIEMSCRIVCDETKLRMIASMGFNKE